MRQSDGGLLRWLLPCVGPIREDLSSSPLFLSVWLPYFAQVGVQASASTAGGVSAVLRSTQGRRRSGKTTSQAEPGWWMQLTGCEIQFSCLFPHQVRPETPHAAATCDATSPRPPAGTPPTHPPTSGCQQVRENCFLSPVMYCETSHLSQQGPKTKFAWTGSAALPVRQGWAGLWISTPPARPFHLHILLTALQNRILILVLPPLAMFSRVDFFQVICDSCCSVFVALFGSNLFIIPSALILCFAANLRRKFPQRRGRFFFPLFILFA